MTALRRTLAAALCLVATLAAAPAAGAASFKKGIWGPLEVDGVSQFPIYKELGAGVFHTRLNWRNIAATRPAHAKDPADPAYAWPAYLDKAIAEGSRYGQRIAVEVSWSPAWANGGRSGRYVPKRARDFADFLAAASRRYPGVRYWVIWSEPTRKQRFMPLRSQTSPTKPLDRRQAKSPRKYAQLLDAAYVALKRVSRSDLVVGSNTWTGGDVSPINWIRALKLPGGRRPRMDLYGHNPFAARRPKLSAGQVKPGYYDICDLDDLARLVDRYLGKAPNGKPLRFFLGEYFVPTDHTNREFGWWVTRPVQASWLRDALELVRGYKRVAVFNWLSLYDDPIAADGYEVNRGLIDVDGNRKPSFDVFARG